MKQLFPKDVEDVRVSRGQSFLAASLRPRTSSQVFGELPDFGNISAIETISSRLLLPDTFIEMNTSTDTNEGDYEATASSSSSSSSASSSQLNKGKPPASDSAVHPPTNSNRSSARSISATIAANSSAATATPTTPATGASTAARTFAAPLPSTPATRARAKKGQQVPEQIAGNKCNRKGKENTGPEGTATAPLLTASP